VLCALIEYSGAGKDRRYEDKRHRNERRSRIGVAPEKRIQIEKSLADTAYEPACEKSFYTA
jgi:hypothetical protein